MPDGRNLRLRKAAALIIEYLLRNQASVTDKGPNHGVTTNQNSSTDGQGETVNEETTEQAGADSTEVNGDLRKLTDQQD